MAILGPHLVISFKLHVYLSPNWDSDGHFEVLTGSVSQFGSKVMTQKAFFSVSIFSRFCKENYYKKENLDFLRENGIALVEKIDNPPIAPQIRPIENYWGIFKMKVYENQGSFNSTY